MKIIINDISYSIDEGATYIMNYNETLDSATVRISHLKEELDIEPFDKVELINDAFTVHMCIDTIDSVQEGLDVPTYVYNLTLVSQTKLLENIVLPNISITPRKIGNPLSIADYLRQYLNEYANHTEWEFANNLDSVFGDDCPEMQWNQPTLREVLTDLMMIKDCIPVLSNNIISWLNLTEKKTEISGNINYITKSQSSENYVSEMRMQMQNVLQTKIQGIDNTCDTYEELTFTTDDYVATTENIYIKTKFPILNIKHLWISCYYYDGKENIQKFKIDLCNIDGDGYGIVYEQKEYYILPVLYRTLEIGRNDTFSNNSVKDYFSQYKNYCIYYTRGDNKILGFTDLQKGVILNFTAQTFQWIKALAFSRAIDNSILPPAEQILYNSINNGYNTQSVNGFFNTFFSIEYETTVSSVFSASKEVKPRNERTVIDNQTNSWVEASSQGFLEYQKANRMGNKMLLINKRSYYPAYKETFIDIGQTYKDSIVFQVQYQFYNNHVEINAYATKNYILQNYFTGVKSKVRTWVNAQNEAFVRNELIKRRCEFSFENKNINVLDSYFLSPFRNKDSYNPIKYAIIKTSETKNNKYLFDCVNRVIGRSIVFTTGFDDNWIIQKHVNTGEHESGFEAGKDGLIWSEDIETNSTKFANLATYPPAIKGSRTIIGEITQLDFNSVNKAFGGIPFNHYKYVNNDGEFSEISIELIENYENNASNLNDKILNIYEKPLITDNDSYESIISENITMHKDNKEIPMLNLQYEFCSDNENIVVTEYFARYQDAVRTKRTPILKYYESYNFNRSLRKVTGSGYNQLTSAYVSISNNQVTFNLTRQTGTKLYICDEDNNVIFIINDDRNVIYLNISEIRR